MSNTFHKKEEKDPLDFKEVHRISNADIRATGKTQCRMENHIFKKISDNELECINCPTCVIVDADNIEKYL